jgi:hypothetical protein
VYDVKRDKIDTPYTHVYDVKRDKIDTPYTHVYDAFYLYMWKTLA